MRTRSSDNVGIGIRSDSQGCSGSYPEIQVFASAPVKEAAGRFVSELRGRTWWLLRGKVSIGIIALKLLHATEISSLKQQEKR